MRRTMLDQAFAVDDRMSAILSQDRSDAFTARRSGPLPV